MHKRLVTDDKLWELSSIQEVEYILFIFLKAAAAIFCKNVFLHIC